MAFDLEGFLGTYKGGISSKEGLLLAEYARRVDHGHIVEIGSFKGKSAVALAHGLGAQANPGDRRVFCVEPHLGFVGVRGGVFGPQDRGDFYKIMLETGYFETVSLINLPSQSAARAWDDAIGFLFIDGDHTYEGVSEDVRSWEPHVEVGGIVAFDDVNEHAPGPVRMVEELVAGGRYTKIDSVGKIVFLRKERAEGPSHSPASGMQILVVCNQIRLAGALFRFERTGRELAKLGHRLAYVCLAENPRHMRHTDFDLITPEEAAAQSWDMTMVPGAGFGEAGRDKLSMFLSGRYGLRVQHVLNAPVKPERREHFLHVNRRFKPDIIIFNNRHWEPGSFSDLQARKFAFLEGAVDPIRFAPTPYRAFPRDGETRTIGGLAHKNPGPLLRAIETLPKQYRLRLYGKPVEPTELTEDLVGSGRVEFLGPIAEENLPDFYAGVDCVVHTEETAGWANLGAEALACGVPLICTRLGTLAFAEHEETALVIDEPTSDAIAAAIERLFADEDLARGLSERGRKRIAKYPWSEYTKSLLEICADDGKSHYTWAPELGLHGKWPLSDRLNGLDPLFERVSGMSVVDFGAAEGVIALECLKRGASLVHGFELDPSRVETARDLCADHPDAYFRQSNLADWHPFQQRNADLLLDGYDVVLFLGIQHHLPMESRLHILKEVAGLAKRFMFVRTTAETQQKDNIIAVLKEEGLQRIGFDSEPHPARLGGLIAFERSGV